MELLAATQAEITFWMKNYDFKKWAKSLDERADEAKRQEKMRENQKLLISGGPK